MYVQCFFLSLEVLERHYHSLYAIMIIIHTHTHTERERERERSYPRLEPRVSHHHRKLKLFDHFLYNYINERINWHVGGMGSDEIEISISSKTEQTGVCESERMWV